MRRLAFGGALASLTLTVAAAAFSAAPPAFVPDKIENFDGRSWAGITLGVTTQDGVKKQFKNGRGDFSSSVELQQEGAQGYKVSAIYPNKDKNATLHAIGIKHANDSDGLPLDRLAETLGPGEELYPPQERYEDWRVIAYPQKGILAFALNGRVPLLLMGHPDRIAETASALLTKEALAVTEYVDPHRDEPRVLTFRDIDIDFSLRGDMRVRREYEEKRDIERDIRSATRPGGLMRWDPSASVGAYNVSVSANYNADKRKGDGSVSVSISGMTPYGQISASSYESFKVEERDRDGSRFYLEDTRYNRAVDTAMREAEAELEQKLRKIGPPPVETFRREWWDRLVDHYRFKTKGGASDGKSGSLF